MPDLAVVARTPFLSFCAGRRRNGPGQITDGTLKKNASAGCVYFLPRSLPPFGSSVEDPNTPPTTRRRPRPETKKRPVYDRAPHPAREMCGQWTWRGCGARLARARARSCGASRREAQGRLKHKPPQRRDGLWFGMWNAPRDTGLVSSCSVKVLNDPFQEHASILWALVLYEATKLIQVQNARLLNPKQKREIARCFRTDSRGLCLHDHKSNRLHVRVLGKVRECEHVRCRVPVPTRDRFHER